MSGVHLIRKLKKVGVLAGCIDNIIVSIIINMSKCLALKLFLFIETIETYVIG